MPMARPHRSPTPPGGVVETRGSSPNSARQPVGHPKTTPPSGPERPRRTPAPARHLATHRPARGLRAAAMVIDDAGGPRTGPSVLALALSMIIPPNGRSSAASSASWLRKGGVVWSARRRGRKKRSPGSSRVVDVHPVPQAGGFGFGIGFELGDVALVEKTSADGDEPGCGREESRCRQNSTSSLSAIPGLHRQRWYELRCD